MSLVLRTIQSEKKRIDYMLQVYKRQLDALPKGSIAKKAAGNNVYYYLKYRNGKKVISEYLGKDGDKVERVRTSLDKRRHIEAMISHLQAERALAERIVEG